MHARSHTKQKQPRAHQQVSEWTDICQYCGKWLTVEVEGRMHTVMDENVPHRLTCLDTWSSIFGMWVLAGGSRSLGWSLDCYVHFLFPSSSLPSALAAMRSSSWTLLEAQSHSARLPSHGGGCPLKPQTKTNTPLSGSFCQVFCHGNKESHQRTC